MFLHTYEELFHSTHRSCYIFPPKIMVPSLFMANCTEFWFLTEFRSFIFTSFSVSVSCNLVKSPVYPLNSLTNEIISRTLFTHIANYRYTVSVDEYPQTCDPLRLHNSLTKQLLRLKHYSFIYLMYYQVDLKMAFLALSGS